jgi:hypothetical protein
VAEEAARALFADELAQAETIGVALLMDIKEVWFEGETAVPSKILLDRLTADKEGRWATFAKGGKPLGSQQLARLLKPFGIFVKNVRVGGQVLKGYERVWFEDVWARYGKQVVQSETQGADMGSDGVSRTSVLLSSPVGEGIEPLHRYTPMDTATSDDFSIRYKTECSGSENGEMSYGNTDCSGVADRNGQDVRERESGHVDGGGNGHSVPPDVTRADTQMQPDMPESRPGDDYVEETLTTIREYTDREELRALYAATRTEREALSDAQRAVIREALDRQYEAIRNGLVD